MQKLLFIIIFSSLFSNGITPDYGPTDYNVITSTSQGFIAINNITVWDQPIVSGTNNNTAVGYCPSSNCDIISIMYGDVCVGWSYSTEINNQIFITVNFNDQITPNISNYPYPGDFVNLNFFDTSEGIMYYGVESTQVFPLNQTTISNINIEGDGDFISDNEGCPLAYDVNFNPFASAGNCSLCENNYSFCGCTNPEASNYDPNATVNNNSCDYGYYFEHHLTNGNNLISFPGHFENSNTFNILENLTNYNENINFILGQGIGMFNTDNGWAGNLNNISPYSGYWLNTYSSINLNIIFDQGKLENCAPYENDIGNNLFSFKWGSGYAYTIDALGGEEFANENYNFILGQGVGLFNTIEGWVGNLNNLQEGQGYWINFKNSNIDFKWGFDNCENPPDIQSLGKEIIKTPEEFQFSQSTEQAFYLIHNNEFEYNENDLLLAYNENVLVGSAYFNTKISVLPVMGKDLSESTNGYCEVGDFPILKMYNSSKDEIIDLNIQLESFKNLKITELELNKIDHKINKLDEFKIESIYPNPFNPKTNIRYSIPHEGFVSISVMDISGRLLTKIYDGFKGHNSYNINWDASSFSSGTYFIKIDFKSEKLQISKTKKIVLIK